MSLLLQSPARFADAPQILSAIRDESCNLAVWERSWPHKMQRLLAAPVAAALVDVRFTAALGGLRPVLDEELHRAHFPATPEREFLAADIVDLAEHFCAALSLAALEVRLEVVTSDACRKFHADYVKARLITTYVGAGTQWIDGEDAARIKQGVEPECVNSLSTGNVGIFKGRLASWTPAIHRSPPIAGTGQKRLVLVLNQAERD